VILLSLIVVAITAIIEIPVGLVLGKTAVNIVSMAVELFFLPFSAIYHYNMFGNLRELKPELAEAQMKTKAGTGFIKVSAIVGIIVPILIAIAVVALVGVGIFSTMENGGRYAPPPGYNGYDMPNTLQQ
jgi:hypothetical protein